MKRIVRLLLLTAMGLMLAACGRSKAPAPEVPAVEMPAVQVPAAEAVTIRVAADETVCGAQTWAQVADAFQAETGIHVELITDQNLEKTLAGFMQNGEYPDVVQLTTGHPAGLTEMMVNVNGLHDLTGALSRTVPGENVKASEKIAGGFCDNKSAAPYGDGKTYLAPMFYSPCGLVYNAELFREKGWALPATWDEMWILGDLAVEENIALFTYPTADNCDTFLLALMHAIGGPEFSEAVTAYEADAWDSGNGKQLLSILDKLAGYTHPSTPAHANNQDFIRNQRLVMTNDALFMPSGTWISSLMAGETETLENAFAWGMTAVPAAGEAPYVFCWFEQVWIPAAAPHISEAEQFVAFLYSDKAAQIFAAAGAVQPILGVGHMLEGEAAVFYSVCDSGARACTGAFADFVEIPGVTVADTFFTPIDLLVTGTISIDDYAQWVRSNSARMAAAGRN